MSPPAPGSAAGSASPLLQDARTREAREQAPRPFDLVLADAKSILTRPSGFIRAFDYTLNPYRGCQFGCSYCYAAFFSPAGRAVDAWGRWVVAKQNAVELIRRKRNLRGARIYMSSVTDPYQPVERDLRLTRGILEALVPQQPSLVVQTRGPLVTRDIDLLRQFERVRVNVTLGTDDDAIRRRYEPACASVEKRLAALRALAEAGIRTGLTMTPMLPLRAAAAFGRRIRDAGIDVVVVQWFHGGAGGRFAAHTGEPAWRLSQAHGWDEAAYGRAVVVLRQELPMLYEGEEGFFPEA